MTARGTWMLALALWLVLPPQQAPAQTPEAPPKVLSAEELAARIDELIAARWKEKEVTPAPLADDATFMRRLSLDLTGRTPRVADLRGFLDDKTPDKRRLLVERLLKHDHYVAHFTTTWTALFVPPSPTQQNRNAFGFDRWVEKQVRENVPYDVMVRELLTTPVNNRLPVRGGGPGQPNPGQLSPIGFYQAQQNKAEDLAASTARLFLGVRIECAQCHHHPFSEWKKEQFWAYAAFFAGVQRPQVRNAQGRLQLAPADPFARAIKIGTSEKLIEAKFLDGKQPQWRDQVESRVNLAEWVTAPDNPYFARTAVNRLWGHFFGVGLIDPVDDEPTEESPISHPKLLEELTRQFVANNHDVKYLIRAITFSQTYQRSSVRTHASQDDPRTFARMAVKGLTPEQLFDSLAQATGYRDVQPDGRVVINAASPRGQFLAKFASQERRTEYQTSILQALSLMNGKLTADVTSLERAGTLAAVADSPFLSTEQKVEALYLAALSRLPRQVERDRLVTYVNSGGPRGDRAAALGDVFWALLNSPEFILNH
jgi:hypothetical protein